MARLVIKSGAPEARLFELKLGANRLGRGEGNDFQIDHPTVSARHCEVILEHDAIRVRDLGSTNGTFIDGNPITEATLVPGRILRLGNVELELESDEVTIAIPRWEATVPEGAADLPEGVSGCFQHPGTISTWRCTQCERYCCDACVHELHRVGGASLELCPECSGRCQPVRWPAPPGKKVGSILSHWLGAVKESFRR